MFAPPGQIRDMYERKFVRLASQVRLKYKSNLACFVLKTKTFIYGTLVDHDYFTGQPFGSFKPQNVRGMDHPSTAIQNVREEKGKDAVLLLDNGDVAQGS